MVNIPINEKLYSKIKSLAKKNLMYGLPLMALLG